MAKVALIISIIVLLATAYLGFQAKEALEKKNQHIVMVTEKLHVTEKNLADTKKELAQTKELLAAANKTIEEQKMQIEGLERDIMNLKAEIEGNKMKITDLEMKVADAEMRYAQLQKDLTDPERRKNNPEMVAIKKEIDDLTKERDELKAVQVTLTQQKKGLEENLVAANTKVKHYETPVTQAGLTGRVVNVNPGWNFVVIDKGDRQGVTVNAPLFVMRGGQMVARLKVTSVEPRTAIADIVPGTLARNNSVQPGDSFVFAGYKGLTPPGLTGPNDVANPGNNMGSANPPANNPAAAGANNAAPLPAR